MSFGGGPETGTGEYAEVKGVIISEQEYEELNEARESLLQLKRIINKL